MKAGGLFSAVLIVAFISYSYAYIYRQQVDVVDGQCQTSDGLKDNGEVWKKETPCEKYECRVTSENKGVISASGCGSRHTDDPKCFLQSGTGVYPNCCQQVVCQ